MKKNLILTLGLFVALVGFMSCGGGDDEARAKALQDSLRNDSIQMAMEAQRIADSLHADSLAMLADSLGNAADSLSKLANRPRNNGGSGKNTTTTTTPDPKPETPKEEPKDDGPKSVQDLKNQVTNDGKQTIDDLKGKVSDGADKGKKSKADLKKDLKRK